MSTPALPRTRWVPMLASQEDFKAAVGTAFALDTPQGQLDLHLVEVVAGRRRRGIEICSAVLRGAGGAGGAMLPKGTYHLRHPLLGLVPLFIAPCCQDENGTHFEAWFSTLANDA